MVINIKVIAINFDYQGWSLSYEGCKDTWVKIF